MDLLFLVCGLKNNELISFYYIIVGKKRESKWNNDMTKKIRDFRVEEKMGTHHSHSCRHTEILIKWPTNLKQQSPITWNFSGIVFLRYYDQVFFSLFGKQSFFFSSRFGFYPWIQTIYHWLLLAASLSEADIKGGHTTEKVWPLFV